MKRWISLFALPLIICTSQINGEQPPPSLTTPPVIKPETKKNRSAVAMVLLTAATIAIGLAASGANTGKSPSSSPS